jgi:hypothetical protein
MNLLKHTYRFVFGLISAFTVYVTFGQNILNFFLSTVERATILYINDNYLEWNHVDDVIRYDVIITNFAGSKETFPTTSTTLDVDLLPEGNLTIRVKAIADKSVNKKDSLSDLYSFYKIPAPNVSFDSINQQIVVEPFSQQNQIIDYKLFDASSLDIISESTNSFLSRSDLPSRYYTNFIRVYSNHASTIRSNASSISYVAGLNPTVEDNLLMWDPLTNLQNPAYQAYLLDNPNDPIGPITYNPFIDLNTLQLTNTNQALSLKVIHPQITSNYTYSNPITLTKTGDFSITYNEVNDSISWTESASASGYKVIIDNVVVAENLPNTIRTYILPNTNVGKVYKIEVETLTSSNYALIQRKFIHVLRNISPAYSSQNNHLTWLPIEGFTYQLKLDSGLIISNTNQSFLNLNSLIMPEGILILKVNYLSNEFENYVHYSTNSIELKKLERVVFESHTQDFLNWSHPEPNVIYRVRISQLGIDEYTLNNFFPMPENIGTYTVRINAIKQGSFIESNEQSLTFNRFKIARPSATISFQSDGRFKIEVNSVENATQYVGELQYFNSIDTMDSNNPFITENFILDSNNLVMIKIARGVAMRVIVKAINHVNYQYIESNDFIIDVIY